MVVTTKYLKKCYSPDSEQQVADAESVRETCSKSSNRQWAVCEELVQYCKGDPSFERSNYEGSGFGDNLVVEVVGSGW